MQGLITLWQYCGKFPSGARTGGLAGAKLTSDRLEIERLLRMGLENVCREQ